MRSLAVLLVLASTAAADAPKPKTTVRFAAPKVSGAFDARGYAAAIAKASAPFLACHDGGGTSAVTASMSFRVQLTGKVTDVVIDAASLPAKTRTCLASAAAKLGFPAPQAVQTVKYAFTFEPPMDAAFSSTLDVGGFDGGIRAPESAPSEDSHRASTIGPGAIAPDTTGAGTGRGAGYGNGEGPSGRAPHPTIEIRNIDVAIGGLRPSLVHRRLDSLATRVLPCYEARLAIVPGLRGTIAVSFTIRRDGRPSSVETSGVPDAALHGCLARELKMILFPKPADGKPLAVHGDLELSPP